MNYNGWSNRATWLANLYFFENMEEYIKDLASRYDFADDKERWQARDEFNAYFTPMLDEQLECYNLPSWLLDFVSISEISWDELFNDYASDFISEK